MEFLGLLFPCDLRIFLSLVLFPVKSNLDELLHLLLIPEPKVQGTSILLSSTPSQLLRFLAKTNINNKILSGYENGVGSAGINTLVTLADFYNGPIEWLFTGNSEMKVHEASGLVNRIATNSTNVDYVADLENNLIRKDVEFEAFTDNPDLKRWYKNSQTF